VLDAGALGVITPVVSNRAEAEAAIAAAKYPPQGVRGVGNSNAVSLWGIANYTQWANDNIVNILIIENAEGVNNADQIASVPGLDVLMIGASDLSSYTGLARNDPKYTAMVTRILEAGKKHNVPVGWPAGNGGAAALNPLIDQGFRFFQLADERGLMMAGARTSLDGVKGR
jgi:4-hydroxy-2-oxoheptanedioate aldolase